MKVFQIKDDICFCDVTRQHPNLLSTIGKYPKNVLFVEAPDYVFEGWGYDENATDNKFIKPEAPEGWLYDEASGTYYMEKDNDTKEPTTSEILNALLGV
jgi:hypothetical protein